MPAAAERRETGRDAIPELSFGIEGCAAVHQAAVPTLAFELRIDGPADVPIRSVMLDVQIQIAARRRPYGDGEQERLAELFGTPDRWGDTLRTLPWTRTTVVVPPFTGTTSVEVPVTCTYDLQVNASSYLNGLAGGEVPLEFLFSGSVFYADGAAGLQMTRITWASDADFALPVATWKGAMERHFPGAAWLRLDRDSFDRLQAYRARNALPTWEAALDSLLEAKGG